MKKLFVLMAILTVLILPVAFAGEAKTINYTDGCKKKHVNHIMNAGDYFTKDNCKVELKEMYMGIPTWKQTATIKVTNWTEGTVKSYVLLKQIPQTICGTEYALLGNSYVTPSQSCGSPKCSWSRTYQQVLQAQTGQFSMVYEGAPDLSCLTPKQYDAWIQSAYH